MTKNLLLEIGLEEIPAHIVSPSSQQLVQKMKQFLDDNRLSYGEVLAFSTPRRLAVMVKDLSDRQVDVEESVKGPAKKIALDAEGNWSKAAMGFVRGQKLSVEEIYFKEINGIEYVHVDKFIEGQAAKSILTHLDKVITAMTFPVSMNWADYHFNYIRPIHWITAMLDEEVIPFSLLDIHTSNTSRGHRFLGKQVTFSTALDYENDLEKEFVIADSNKRQNMIISQIEDISKEHNWNVSINPDLLEEINNLVEYPTAFYGKYNPTYLEIPEEILITSMRDHQRYVDVADHSGNLLPYFISVRNGNAEFIENVVRGNEKVLTARLEDGLFFYEEDKKRTIEKCVEQLKQVTFHEKIGSVYEKIQRVRSFAATIGTSVGLTDDEMIGLNRAAEIYKFDLVTNVVGEFPELQGIMGEKYALLQGESPAVATAIREHYLPISSDGELPKSSIGAVLALADKLESMMSFFAIGKIPTGSNDPFALRRQAYGLVRIIEKENWFFPIDTLRKDILSTLTADSKELLPGYEKTGSELVDFIKARLQQFMRNEKIRYDIIDAALHSNQENLIDILETSRTLEKHLTDSSFKPTIESLTRVLNLARKNNKVIDFIDHKINVSLFETDSEANLANQVEKIQASFNELETEGKFKELESLQPFIDDFFDENMVMTGNESIRNNRLSLLMQIARLTLSFASIDKLVVK
ncbi:glycine--tRNA ligase subunit beta [Carnobacterium funditum]|uniref:glycine--tRNA ligase subunit beta n=1 Tax=Carnobacterium funditum TaxID=2752 RepID=UPI00055133B5|nr:glycine--tRNA ligase subunit beta [Carnobacterium funditum]